MSNNLVRNLPIYVQTWKFLGRKVSNALIGMESGLNSHQKKKKKMRRMVAY